MPQLYYKNTDVQVLIVFTNKSAVLLIHKREQIINIKKINQSLL